MSKTIMAAAITALLTSVFFFYFVGNTAKTTATVSSTEIREGAAPQVEVAESQPQYPCETGGATPILLQEAAGRPGDSLVDGCHAATYNFASSDEEWRSHCRIRYAILHILENKIAAGTAKPYSLPVGSEMWVPDTIPHVGEWKRPGELWSVRPEHCMSKLRTEQWSRALSLCAIIALGASHTDLTSTGEPVIRRVPNGYGLVLHTNILDKFGIYWTVKR